MFDEIFHKALPLGFGLMRLPSLDPEDPGKIDIEQVKVMVDTFICQGFTYFDTAWMYCAFQSENAVKEALTSRHSRDSFTLATKLHAGFLQTKEDRDRIFNEQKKKTGAEFFDYYLLHDINAHSIDVYNELDCFEWIRAKKEAGQIRHMGFSFHDSPELLDRVLTEHPEMEFVQIQLNYLDYNNPGVQSRRCYEICVKHHKPVIVMEPVKGGTLVNLPKAAAEKFKALDPKLSPASYAIRFAASHENVKMVLSGMSTIAQLEDNTAYMKDFRPLDEQERKAVKEVVQILNSTIAIPCTGCSYCTDGCPEKILIPKYFALYNAEMKQNPDNSLGWTPQKEYYDNLSRNYGRVSDCIGCRQCERICPQHLPILEYFKQVKERFEA